MYEIEQAAWRELSSVLQQRIDAVTIQGLEALDEDDLEAYEKHYRTIERLEAILGRVQECVELEAIDTQTIVVN